jgi:hypothetical protein
MSDRVYVPRHRMSITHRIGCTWSRLVLRYLGVSPSWPR